MTFEQIKARYVATFKQKKIDIQAAYEANNIEDLHDLVHKLTGSSGSYGFEDLCSFCRTVSGMTLDSEETDMKMLEKYLEKIYVLLMHEANKD